MVAFVVVMIFALMAILGNFNIFGLQDAASSFNLENRYIKAFSSWRHPLGTDNFGRDILARVVVGTKVSLFLGAAAGLFMIPIAIIMGSLSGYYGKYVDDIIMYVMSVIIAIPGLLIIMHYRIGLCPHRLGGTGQGDAGLLHAGPGVRICSCRPVPGRQ